MKSAENLTEVQVKEMCSKLISGLETLISELKDSNVDSTDLEFCYSDPIGVLTLKQDCEDMNLKEEIEECKKYKEKFKSLFGFNMQTYDCDGYVLGLNEYQIAVAWLFTTNVTGRPVLAKHKVSKEFWIEQAKYVISELSMV